MHDPEKKGRGVTSVLLHTKCNKLFKIKIQGAHQIEFSKASLLFAIVTRWKVLGSQSDSASFANIY